MSDGLPLLTPGDPQNHLSVEARKRVQRAYIESDKFIWETEVLIEARHIDRYGSKADALRKKANFDKAKLVLSALRREFSRIGLTDRTYRQYMELEIEGVCAPE